LYVFHTQSLLAFALGWSISACGTIVGNGNSCRTSSCEQESTRENPTSKKSEPLKNESRAPKTTEESASNTDNAPAGSNTAQSQEASNNSAITSGDLVLALFDSCSAIFAQTTSPDSTTFTGSFGTDQIHLTIDTHLRSGTATIKAINQNDESRYTKSFASTCTDRKSEHTSSEGKNTVTEEWDDQRGRKLKLMVVTESIPNSSLVRFESISIQIDGSTLVLLVSKP
jgi:hypothetical protein